MHDYKSSKELLESIYRYKALRQVDLLEPVKTIDAICNSLFDIYNPFVQGVLASDTMIVLPITYRWLDTFDSELKSLNNIKLETINNRYSDSGEAITKFDDRFNSYLNWVFHDLPKDIQNSRNDSFKNSSISQWVLSLSNKYVESNIQVFILPGGAVWTHDINDHEKGGKYSHFVGLEASTGAFRVSPLETVIIHELAVGGLDCYLDLTHYYNHRLETKIYDLHIDKEDTLNDLKKIRSNDIEILNNQETVDNLYQSSVLYQFVTTMSFIKFLGK